MSRSTRISKNFQPSQRCIDYALMQGLDIEQHKAMFIVSALTDGTKRTDWDNEFYQYLMIKSLNNLSLGLAQEQQQLMDEAMAATEETNTVPNLLTELAELYERKDAQYGESHQRIGEILNAIFPEALTLNSPADHMRYSLFNMMVWKLNRYAENITNGGHFDSLDDLAVYAMMARKADINEKGDL